MWLLRKEAEWRFLRLKVYAILRKAKKRQINEFFINPPSFGFAKIHLLSKRGRVRFFYIYFSFMVQQLYGQSKGVQYGTPLFFIHIFFQATLRKGQTNL